MKNNMNMKSVVICLSMLFACPLFAVVIGSNSIPSLQPTIVFPASDSDNSVLGFAWMKNGFTLENAATSCLFAS
ncbi:MAG: hypothetical protein P4L31_02545, partial [Candidatus Babeliales bacterium]|nr:hypothetical protein [Candidatus Babeliales bacterium]